jgi:hypothetical protein
LLQQEELEFFCKKNYLVSSATRRTWILLQQEELYFFCNKKN